MATTHTPTFTQYGIKRDGQKHVMPIHLKHGDAGRDMALASIASRGGQLMVRTGTPDEKRESGVVGVTEWKPAPVLDDADEAAALRRGRLALAYLQAGR